MFNHKLKLNENLFDSGALKVSTRAGFGRGLALAGADPAVVALSADLSESLSMTEFREKYPERYFEMGVAEQNLVTVASGMAAMGKIPFVGSYAVFSPGRNWEQIRTTICYNDRPVKIIGSHTGLNVGPDGGSHQSLEDIALMRVLPRMTVISPCDAIQAKQATLALVKNGTPVYLRLAREKSPLITTEETPFEIGKAQEVYRSKKIEIRDSKSERNARHSMMGSTNSLHAGSGLQRGYAGTKNRRVGIVATGPILYEALWAARGLEEKGREVIVLNISTIKPLDEKAVIDLANETIGLVTVEEHQIAGGLGSAVAECLSRHRPTHIEFVAVKDRFGQSGNASELIEHYGLGHQDIARAVEKIIARG